MVLDSGFGEIQQRIGAFYAAFMDAERAKQRRLAPIQGLLDEIDAVTSSGELFRLSAAWQRRGMDSVLAAGRPATPAIPNASCSTSFSPASACPMRATTARTPTRRSSPNTRTTWPGSTHAGVENPDNAAAKVIDLEKTLAAAHWDRVTLRDAQKRYNLFTRDQAEQLMPLLAEAIAGWGLSPSQAEEIVVAQPDVLPAFQRALTEQPLQSWKHWLRLQVVRWAAPLLHSELVDEHFDFYSKTLNGTPAQKERWKRGVALTNAHLPEDVAQIYVARHYPPEAREAMEQLIAALIEAYATIHLHTGVDGGGHPIQGAGEAGHLHHEDRLPGPLDRLLGSGEMHSDNVVGNACSGS